MHVVDWFDVLDEENRPLLTEREILRNLQAIVADADKLPTSEVRAISLFFTRLLVYSVSFLLSVYEIVFGFLPAVMYSSAPLFL